MWTRRDILTPFVARVGAGIIFARGGFCSKPETIFETAMISSGNNYPSLDMRANRLTDICVALHRRQVLASIEHDLGISSSELRGKLDSLVVEGLVKTSPTAMP